LVVLASASAARASVILYDGFGYSAGALRTNGGWVGSNATVPSPTVVSGSLTYPGLATSTGNSVQLTKANGTADRVSTGTITSGTIFYSFIIQLSSVDDTAAGISGTGGAFFAGFDDHSSGTTFSTPAGLFVRRDAGDTTKINLGISTTGSANKSFSGAFAPTDTLFVVGSFTFGAPATLDVYANGSPAIPSDAPVSHTLTTTGSDATTASILSFFLRQNTGEPSTIVVDELRIGTTWADVAPVPEPVALGFVGLGCMSLIARPRTRALVSKRSK
jgi:hypothetical protein